MNKDRRKELARIVALIERLRETIDEARDALDSVKSEEQEYFDAMPESFQSGDKGSAAQAAIDAMDNAYSDLEYLDLDAIIGQLETAQE